MLMIRRHEPPRHSHPIRNFLSYAHGHGGHNSCGPDLIRQTRILPEMESKDILIVTDRDDRLQDQHPTPRDDGIPRPEVRMLPQNPVVDLMQAHRIGDLDRIASGSDVPAVEVFDMAQTVAAKLEIVGVTSCAVVTEVEGGFAGVRAARVGVGCESPLVCTIVDGTKNKMALLKM